jgi:RNA polymerase sigma-54 factor
MTTAALQKQQQTLHMAPEHLMGKAVLKMSVQELQSFVQEQLAENPALMLEQDDRCPSCGCPLTGSACAACGSRVTSFEDSGPDDGDWHEGLWISPNRADSDYEPLSHVAAPKSLADHLKEQIRVAARDEDVRIAEFLVDCLDDYGYLREPLIEIARRFKTSVPKLEEVLRLIQSLDPPGVGARDLRECMLLQLQQLEDSALKALAEVIVRDHWEGLRRMKLGRIAAVMGVGADSVSGAIAFIRDNLTPHPASAFRDPWEKLAPSAEPRRPPDVALHASGEDLVAEVLDPVTGRAAIDETYSSLYLEIQQKRSGFPDGDKAHIRECVQSARRLIEALEFRKVTLRRVAEELVRSQADFILKGPAFLKPLTRKEIARRLGVHESTVCRATADKTVQLPSGEVITFDLFFDSALPVKELVRKLAVQRLSDGEIAEKLAEAGIRIARRTVAKYRDQLHLLPLEYRLAA